MYLVNGFKVLVRLCLFLYAIYTLLANNNPEGH